MLDGEVLGQREEAEGRQGVGTAQRFDARAGDAVRPGVAAVEGAQGAVAADLQQDEGDELLAVVRCGGVRSGRGVPGAGAQMAGEGPVEAAQEAAEVGFVGRGVAEAGEDGGGGAAGGDAVAAYVAHDGADAVPGGDDVVEVAAAGGAVGGDLGGCGAQAGDSGGRRPQRQPDTEHGVRPPKPGPDTQIGPAP
ncbi:hypothetical protein GCM10020256_63860 [Streptomyces thermocoprophilus]